MPTKKIHFTIEESLYKKLKQIAINESTVENQLTTNEVMRLALLDFVKSKECKK